MADRWHWIEIISNKIKSWSQNIIRAKPHSFKYAILILTVSTNKAFILTEAHLFPFYFFLFTCLPISSLLFLDFPMSHISYLLSQYFFLLPFNFFLGYCFQSLSKEMLNLHMVGINCVDPGRGTCKAKPNWALRIWVFVSNRFRK